MTLHPIRSEWLTFEEDVGDQCGCHRSNGDQIECEADHKHRLYYLTTRNQRILDDEK